MSAVSATILGLSGLQLTAEEAAFFRDTNPFGFIIFARNVDTPSQVLALTDALRAAVGRDAPVFIDQEGGRVQRLRPPHWRDWLPPMEEVDRLRPLGAQAMARGIWLRHRLIAAELRACGIDGNCAPCADLATDQTHPFLKNRCFSKEVAEVVYLARAAADGLLAGGVLPVLKHIPGHGRADLDTHLALPTVSADPEVLEASDFAAFRGLNDLPLGMTAHIVFSGFDSVPATQSAIVIEAIRQQIGFDGLLMTDDLNMQALSGTLAERTRASISAGCDIALHCNGLLDEMQAVVDAAGALTTTAEARAARALSLRRAPQVLDMAPLAAEHAALMEGRAFV